MQPRWVRRAGLPAVVVLVAGCQATSVPTGGPEAPAAGWRLAEPPRPTDEVLSLLVREAGCASGQPADGRIVEPEVLFRQDSVVITVRVEPRSDSEECPGNPETPYVLELTEPVGTRALLDGSTSPPSSPGSA